MQNWNENSVVNRIARDELNIATLSLNGGSSDHHNLCVLDVQRALLKAFRMGQKSTQAQKDHTKDTL